MTAAAPFAEELSSSETVPGSNRLRVAVIGCGPKGLYCLESLSRQLSESRDHLNDRKLKVVIYEPAEFPGAGVIYAPTQPPFLRMNFASRFVDGWKAESRRQGTAPSLLEWLSQHHHEYADPEAFVPRAMAGEYLHWCFERVVKSLAMFADVKRLPYRAERVDRQGSTWQVEAEGSSEHFDEVLITVGHEGWRPAKPTRGSSLASKFEVDCPFPVSRRLSVDHIPPGSTVAIRGFALTWIDATLAMTEGRGGRFVQNDTDWAYNPSGLEPISIRPFSRTGRPMLPKSCAERLRLPDRLSEVWQRGRQRILQLPTSVPIDFVTQIWPVLFDTVSAALQLIRGEHSQAVWNHRIAAWWENWNANVCSSANALQFLRSGYEVAVGVRMPDEPWAFGEAWRRLYPALVARVSHGGLAENSWKDFRAAAVELERIAFGPPAENIGRMLALIDTGFVSLDLLDGETAVKKAGKVVSEVDVIVNAIIPSPVDIQDDSVLGNLLRQQIIRRAAGAGGIEVNHAGRPINEIGEPVAGLAIVGRATEGCVLGNDTLSRRMHHHPDRWGAEIVQRLLTSRRADQPIHDKE